jgi:thioredoxin 1
MSLREIGTKDFKSEVEDYKGVVLVEFGAEWCMPCKRLKPTLEKLAKVEEGVKILQVDTEDNEDLCIRFGIKHLPTMILFKDGVIKETKLGLLTLEQLRELVKV